MLDQLFPSQGLLLLSRSGQVVQSSPKARALCQALQTGTAFAPRKAGRKSGRKSGWRGQDLWALPSQIRTLCKVMLESREEFPDQRLQLHEEIDIGSEGCIHLNGEWVDWGEAESTYLLITLENPAELSVQRAAFDAHRYQLTAREADVWQLALQGLSYGDIAAQLFVSLNTVKRHMKSIYEKRRR
ncbi:helix-turn-helix transcriptional regulator [Nodosilinea nodulosa]|uniref:helix-turn-helix transcriptional regulator n=1 Tax=Nodosilinea nodulosa TaxID=416001 RepID=UPI0018C1F679|nr:helix-turn-helix transcriptional regulator [Nodosilinea nodulosa]